MPPLASQSVWARGTIVQALLIPAGGCAISYSSLVSNLIIEM